MKKTIRLFCLLILVLILSVAPTIGKYFAKNGTTKRALLGGEIGEQMVLVVWNVDTFDGGSVSKSSILEMIAKIFEKQNKGLFVIVKNLTVEQFEEKIKNENPDVISFGSGIFDLIGEHAKQGVVSKGLLPNVAAGVMKNDVAFAAPWALGAYFVFATEESLARAGVDENEILENCTTKNYQKLIGKKAKTVHSLSLGSDIYHSAKELLSAETEISNDGLIPNWQNISYYDAYVQFVSGNSTFLLGTHRDITRLENKQTQGAISGLCFQMLSNTDLVQYAVTSRGCSEKRAKYADLFCLFLQSNEAQKLVFAGGLLPVVSLGEQDTNGLLNAKMSQKLTIKNLY